MKKNLLILFSSFLFLSNIAFGSITLQESKAFVVKELKKEYFNIRAKNFFRKMGTPFRFIGSAFKKRRPEK